MKKLQFLLAVCLGFFFVSSGLIGQNWTVITENGSVLKAVTSTGEKLDVIAVIDEGDDCFMDIKAVKGDNLYPVKLISVNATFTQATAITPDGETMQVMAYDNAGGEREVSGVSRFGNTIVVAAVSGSDFHDIIAKSDDGRTKKITGVKFKEVNEEMEIGEIKIVAHLKAIPEMEVKTTEESWDVVAKGDDGSSLEVVSLNKKGKEYPIKALSVGGSFYILNVKAMTGREESNVKLMKSEEGIRLEAIDVYGRRFPVKAKMADGTYLDIIGGMNCGKTIDITATSASGVNYLLHAISPEGDVFDVKGIKLSDQDSEGMVQGLNGIIVFYGHVKALPPAYPDDIK